MPNADYDAGWLGRTVEASGNYLVAVDDWQPRFSPLWWAVAHTLRWDLVVVNGRRVTPPVKGDS